MDSSQSITILTIEDDRLIRQALASYMQSLGYSVLQAEDGAAGLEMYRKKHPDLVITDLRLPKIDGMEVLSTIRKESPDIPVIIVSGMGTLRDAIKALKLGARDYVTKPITDMGLLKYAADRALERVRLVKENKKYQDFLEEEVQRKTAELHQAQKLEAIGILAGGIAHDFNNILSAIMGFAELAQCKSEKGSEVSEYLRQVLKASYRARELVRQILTFSRKTDTERHPVQAALVIKEAIKLLRATLPMTTQLNQQIRKDKTLIMADPTEIHQVMTNLCTNAFHALPEEQGIITVGIDEISITKDDLNRFPELTAGNYLELTVSDNGCGMDSTVMASIFDPFFTTKEKEQGTGLGLSVVHGIVTACGGTITAQSEPGKGTTFTLLFPVIKGVDVEKVETAEVLPFGNESILFVDDEKDLRLLAKRMLAYLGYSVVCCSSGQEALEKVREASTAFDLVITDQSMPIMPGIELSRQLLAINPDLPVLLCTGYSSVINEEKALAEGLSGFLLKPLSIKVLARKIRDSLDRKLPEL